MWDIRWNEMEKVQKSLEKVYSLREILNPYEMENEQGYIHVK